VDGLQLGGDYPGNAFRAFHDALRALMGQGIALAVCSKNDERLALEAMDRHPDMRIRPADLVAHRINWKPKSINLRDICTELNLGLESVLFIDDSPVERDEVRRALPAVKVLDLPEDPSDYARCLLASPWVASVQHTHEDTARLRNYRTRRRVEHERETAADFTEFLISLGMTVYLQPLDDTNSVRAEQLCQKTNQFNSTTRRYTRRDLETIRSAGGEVVVIGLEDRYTERENVGVLVLLPAQDDPRTGTIDLYLLSCRVLGRGLETALVSWACRHLGARGHREVRAQVVQTERNAPVRDVYAGAGFAATQDGWWVCRPDDVVEAPDWITWVDLMPNTQSAS
jgi:FkbH-like protein